MLKQNLPAVLLFVFLTTPILAYLQIPLIEVKNGTEQAFVIQIEIANSKYKIGIALQKQKQYLNPPKNSKSPKHNNSVVGYLSGHSLEQNNNIEGWRRYFIEAFLFVQARYSHKFELNLDWMEIKHNSFSTLNGVMSLSPSIVSDRFFNEIKKNYPHMTGDIFGIYLGPSNSKNAIQFGGYQSKYAYQTIVGHLHKIELLNYQDQWVVPISKFAFTKDDHGKYADYVLSPASEELKLSLSHNKLTIPRQVLNVLLIALESEHITCKLQTRLECQNMTSLDMSLHQFVFPVNADFSVNISMYRLLNQCDTKFQHCSFNVEIGQRYEVGTSFFKDHYTVFNMQQKHILIGLSNKYPSEWFSTVYILRIMLVLFIIMVITLCVVDSPKYISFLRNRKDDVEGIELVSRQQLHQF